MRDPLAGLLADDHDLRQRERPGAVLVREARLRFAVKPPPPGALGGQRPDQGARATDEGCIVPLTLATAKAIVVYLRARQSHGRAQTSQALWLGTRNRGPMTGSGVYRMIKRRAEQAGYEPSVYPHMFRHTFAHDFEMGRIASDATFPRRREHALPAAQRAALRRSGRDGARRNALDLGCQQPVASGLTMMRPVRLHRTPA